jgi:hypothetical protein
MKRQHNSEAQSVAKQKFGSSWLVADQAIIDRAAKRNASTPAKRRYIPPQRYSTNPLVRRISVRRLASLFDLSEDRIFSLLARDAIHEDFGGDFIIDESRAKQSYKTLIKD